MWGTWNVLPPTYDKSNLPPMEVQNEIRDHVINILRSMEYFLLPEMRGVGPTLVLFPLRVAMQYFILFPGPELGWCYMMFQRVKDMGVPFGNFLAKVDPTSYPIRQGGIVDRFTR